MMTLRTTSYSLALMLVALACGSHDKGDQGKPARGPDSTATGGSSTSGGSGGGGGTTGGSAPRGGSSGSAGSAGSGVSGSSSGGSAGRPEVTVVPGEPCNSVDSALPPKPCMVNVSVQVTGNAAEITFDPVDGAADYRVYALPRDSDISSSGDDVTIKNALYRCAGTRMATPVAVDGQDQLPGGAIKTLVDNQMVSGYTRTLADATLGYVSAIPGDGLAPVYALGDSAKDSDNDCYFMRWTQSRVKQYVSSTDRDTLLGKAYRDDGIVFYAPAAGADGTRQIMTSLDSTNDRYYYAADSAEAGSRMGGSAAFSVYTDPADGLVPLMRVYYQNGCGRAHDELAVGQARFDRARYQGDTSPVTELHWSGLDGATTLVVEALADGCPDLPGLLAPFSDPAYTDDFGNARPAWISFDDARALSPSGELYVNGQFDAANHPRPIARSFVKVKPADPPDLDWFEGFDDADSLGTLTDEPCGNPVNCFQEYREAAKSGDLHFISQETTRHVATPLLGELWLMYDDWAADTAGKFRFTANQPATIADDSFLYATMETNAFTTTRRYPQIIISDQQAPVQWNLVNGKSLVIQTFGDWPYRYELEICDHRTWDVNNQCPRFDLYHYYEDGTTDKVKSLAPNAEVGEMTAVDRTTRFEVWVSSQRAYLYLNGAPYGCVDLPSGAPSAGSATVTFGDTLYHSGVDSLDYYDYMKKDWQYDTRRHFDNLGFKSGVAAPDWDESRLPCVSTILAN